VGQLNQFGMIFWLLLSFDLLLVSLSARTTRLAAGSLLLAATFAHLSLWSHEAPLVVIAAWPVVAGLSLRARTRRQIATLVTYAIVPATFAGLNAVRYFASGSGGSYQLSIIRPDFSISSLMSDLAFNVYASLAFWTWGTSIPSVADEWVPVVLAVCGAVCVAAGFAWFQRSARHSPATSSEGSSRVLLATLACGVTLLVLSFPVYLLLSGARALWRTQFLSGMGAALVLGSLASLFVMLPIANRARAWLPVVAVSVIAGHGVWASYRFASFHYEIWERHRKVIDEVLQVAPSIKPNTLVMVVNVPEAPDPLGHNMWLDMALRLAYPQTPVAASYYLRNGKPGPGVNMALADGKWVWNGADYPPAVRSVAAQNTVIIRYDEGGHPKLLESVPPFVSSDRSISAIYSPTRVIVPNHLAATARRRYMSTAGF
jgi:hypothetical protein